VEGNGKSLETLKKQWKAVKGVLGHTTKEAVTLPFWNVKKPQPKVGASSWLSC
jgi:hypothetical protein